MLPLVAATVAGGALGYLSGKKGKSERNPYGTLNPEQESLVKALGPRFNETLGAGAQTYGGQLQAPISDLELDALSRSQALIGQTGQTLSSLQNFQDYDKLFREEVETPTMDFWRREIQPTLEESLPTFATSRANVLSRNLQGVSEQLAQQRWQGRLSARDQALQAAGQMPATTQEMMRQAAVPREITQAGLDKAYLDYIAGNEQYANSIQQMLQFLNISTVTQKDTPDTRWSNAIAGAGFGLNLATGGLGGGGSTPTKTPTNMPTTTKNGYWDQKSLDRYFSTF